MRHQVILGILLVGAALVAVGQDSKVPADFQGKWAGSQDRCGVPHEASLTIQEGRIDFYEGGGRVLSTIVISPLEIEIEIEKTGEGQPGRDVRRFVLSEGGRTLTDVTNPRYQLSRVRCD